MALPASRIIGHKEYAAGRKVDPIYDMNWRRNRVASFTPRGAGVSKAEVLDGLKEFFGKDAGTQQAWDEDVLRRVQSMHIGGFLSVGDAGAPAGASLPPRAWQQGGDLGWLDRRTEGTLQAIDVKLSESVKKMLDAAKPTAEVKVDAAAVAGLLAKDVGFVGALAKAIVAEQDRVARDGDPRTGPTT